MVEVAEDFVQNFVLSRFHIVLDLDIGQTNMMFLLWLMNICVWLSYISDFGFIYPNRSHVIKSRDRKMKPSLNRRKKRRKHFFVSIIILTIVVKSRLSTRSREIPKKKPKTPDPSLSIWFWNIILVPLTLVEPSRSKNALPVGKFAFRYRIQFHSSSVLTLE